MDASPQRTAPADGSPAPTPDPTVIDSVPKATLCSLVQAPSDARVRPCLELSGDLGEVLDELGRRGVLQLLVEGGATVAHQFHHAGLVNRYVVYLAPSLAAGNDAMSMFRGPAARDVDSIWRGRFRSVTALGTDLRIELDAA